MRVFVTGSTGFVGTAVVAELIAHGHQVLGLARSDDGAAALQAAGAQVQRGTVDDLDILTASARACDAVAHLAFNHDFSRFAENCAQDGRAIDTLTAALEGTGKPFLATSGLAGLASGRAATEGDRLDAHKFPRLSEPRTEAAAARGVKASVVRLAPSVHGRGDHGFIPTLIGIARQKGVAAYVGDGANRWPGVGRADAARVFRLALERGEGGRAWHAVGEEGVPMKAIQTLIGERLGLPVVSKTPEEASEHFGWMGMFVGMDLPTSSRITQDLLGWTPTAPGLLEDMADAGYLDR